MIIIVENQERHQNLCAFLEKDEFGQSDAPLNIFHFSYRNLHCQVLRKKSNEGNDLK